MQRGLSLESQIARALRAVLSPLPPSAPIPGSEPFTDFQLGLERYLPDFIGWRGESLDGFRFCVARKLGPDAAELIGLALLVSDQAWTPVWLRLRLSPDAEEIAAIDCKLGERGEGAGGVVRIPYESSALTKVLFRLPGRIAHVAWAFEASAGDLGGVGHLPGSDAARR